MPTTRSIAPKQAKRPTAKRPTPMPSGTTIPLGNVIVTVPSGNREKPTVVTGTELAAVLAWRAVTDHLGLPTISQNLVGLGRICQRLAGSDILGHFDDEDEDMLRVIGAMLVDYGARVQLEDEDERQHVLANSTVTIAPAEKGQGGAAKPHGAAA